MKPETDKILNEEPFDGLDTSEAPGVEDFLKELEAKERDLDISSEMVIEIAEADFDDAELPDFVLDELGSAERRDAGGTVKSTAIPGQPSYRDLENELAALKNRLTVIEAERVELIDASQRRKRDFDNYKTRVDRERSETYDNQLCQLATQMLPIFDNLNRALDFALMLPDNRRDEMSDFISGVELVNQQLSEIFANMGVRPIPSVGEPFDPHFHEAVATVESADMPPNTVSDEMLRGYAIGSKVIRHSLVKVVKASADETGETAVDSPPDTSSD